MKKFIYRNINELGTLQEVAKKSGKNILPEDLCLLQNAAIVFDENEILWVGQDLNIPSEYKNFTEFDLSDHVVLPEIVDSHTHLVFAGDRSDEYVDRLNGVDYQDIAKRGGGILFTCAQTILASEQDLFNRASKRIEFWAGPTWVRTADGPVRSEDEDGGILWLPTPTPTTPTPTAPAQPPITGTESISCEWREGDAW